MASHTTSAAFTLFSESADSSSGLAFSSPPPPPPVEVFRSEVSDSVKYTVESVNVGELTLLKGRVSTQEVLSLSNLDLVPGKYEGGLKLWEGSIDLVKALQSEIQSKSLRFSGKRVLELGCGHGLPAIFACLQGATAVHFQDFNAEVLRCLTIPNVNANLKSSKHSGSEVTDKDIRFFAGDWSNMVQLLPFVQDTESDQSSETSRGYDIILMAETVYSISSIPSLYKLIKKCLCCPTGVVYMAAKKHYFGVGGGSRRFLSVMDKDGVMTGHMISEVTDGSSNVREVWKLTFKQK
ncbi:hypothetical protein MLD38_035733 [Melastoma candidum]|uniref:Uncharacterized protein n=1 Tax=Melastoma candidum TaxID=119954 RepID=A0ACB9LHT4_9MYRT|nr:hypothetical protein MLD38_035733 [Melastoma candidum]